MLTTITKKEIKRIMKLLLSQIKSIIDPNLPLVSNLSNASAVLNQMENINWVGFYIVKNDTLYLGPFQGDVACAIIQKGRGVCGTSFEKKETIIVPNVNEFKGHIACSSLSKSEIVTPIIKNNEVVALIDIDAPIFDRFSNEDKELLEEVASVLAPLF